MAVAALAPVAANAGRALVSAAPAIASKAMDYVRRATGGRIGNASQLVAYAGQSKNALAVVAEGLVKSGVHPGTIFTDDVMRNMADADLLALRVKLLADFNQVYGAIDAASPFKPSSEATRDLIALETVNFVQKQFGVPSSAGLRRLHAHLKLFAAMDEAQLGQTLALRDAALGGAGRF